jgi:hypothetical protein
MKGFGQRRSGDGSSTSSTKKSKLSDIEKYFDEDESFDLNVNPRLVNRHL